LTGKQPTGYLRTNLLLNSKVTHCKHAWRAVRKMTNKLLYRHRSTKQMNVQKINKIQETYLKMFTNFICLPLRLPAAITTLPNRFSKPKMCTNNLEIRNTNFYFHHTRRLVKKGKRQSTDLQVQKQWEREKRGGGGRRNS
jgi:hypothetical protein